MSSPLAAVLTLSLLGTLASPRTQPGGFIYVNPVSQASGMGALGSSLNDLHFVNYRNGVAIGYNGLFRTDDGGLTWRGLPLPDIVSDDGATTGRNWYAVRMTAPEEIWALGQIHPGGLDRSRLMHSTDGGQSWEAVLHGQISGAVALEVTGEGEVWAMCHDRAFVTRDGGERWERVNLGLSGWHGLRGVCTPAPGLYYAVADTEGLRGPAALLRSVDGGETWERLCPEDSFAGLWRIQFISPAEGWAAGSALYHTTDGGESWEEVPTLLAAGQWIRGLRFFQDGRGWLAATVGWGGGGAIEHDHSVIYTWDRGEHWTPVEGGWKSVHAMCWLDPEHGWIGGRVPGYVPAAFIGLYNWR